MDLITNVLLMYNRSENFMSMLFLSKVKALVSGQLVSLLLPVDKKSKTVRDLFSR